VATSLAVAVVVARWLFRRPPVAYERGRRVVVTGAASGIGRAVAVALAQKGWVVFAVDVNASALEELKRECGPQVQPCVVSVGDNAQVEKLAKELGKDGGGLDALVNVAGILPVGPAASQSDEEMVQVMQINALGLMRMCREMLPLLLRVGAPNKPARIVNVTSVSGKVAWPWAGCYAASKGAAEMFTDGLRRESKVCKLPLIVCTVAPGAVLTPLAASHLDKKKKWLAARESNPFIEGCLASVRRQEDLLKQGSTAEMVSVTPEYVCASIMHALESATPKARYVVMHALFAPLYYLPLVLPEWLGDRLMEIA
jgi:NAD(P)-dependent dehydrogenase (short-subunit alcohol dehydrogenase family)